MEIEVECKSCHIIDLVVIQNGPLDLHGWSTCPNGCCWLCNFCQNKIPNIDVRKVVIKGFKED